MFVLIDHILTKLQFELKIRQVYFAQTCVWADLFLQWNIKIHNGFDAQTALSAVLVCFCDIMFSLRSECEFVRFHYIALVLKM